MSVRIIAKDRGVHGEHLRQKTNWMKLKSYILTIHLGEGDSDLQTALWVILGWFNDNASITVKV